MGLKFPWAYKYHVTDELGATRWVHTCPERINTVERMSLVPQDGLKPWAYEHLGCHKMGSNLPWAYKHRGVDELVPQDGFRLALSVLSVYTFWSKRMKGWIKEWRNKRMDEWMNDNMDEWMKEETQKGIDIKERMNKQANNIINQ